MSDDEIDDDELAEDETTKEKWINSIVQGFIHEDVDPYTAIGWIGSLLIHAFDCETVSNEDVEDFCNKIIKLYKEINVQRPKRYSIQEINDT